MEVLAPRNFATPPSFRPGEIQPLPWDAKGRSFRSDLLLTKAWEQQVVSMTCKLQQCILVALWHSPICQVCRVKPVDGHSETRSFCPDKPLKFVLGIELRGLHPLTWHIGGILWCLFVKGARELLTSGSLLTKEPDSVDAAGVPCTAVLSTALLGFFLPLLLLELLIFQSGGLSSPAAALASLSSPSFFSFIFSLCSPMLSRQV